MTAKLYAPRGADLLLNYIFPSGVTLVGYTVVFNVYDSRNGSTIVTFGTTPSANSSEVQPVGNVLALTMKKADVNLLPVDVLDDTSPAILAFDMFVTSGSGIASKVHGGSFIVQPFGSSISSNGNDIAIAFEGQDIQIQLESGTTFTEAPTGAVRFDGAQSLTSPQKQTARQNVDVPSVADLTTHTTDILNPHAVTKAQVGLGSVDNTSDANKPISTATQAALNLKAPINNPTFTGTVGGVTKSMVGLGNVDNTSDANKPVSTATQAALDLKADLTAVAGLRATRLDNLVSMDRRFWSTDNTAPVTYYQTDGYGFFWTLTASATSNNWYTNFIDIIPTLGFSVSADILTNMSAGTFRMEVFGYTSAGASLGSISTVAVLSGVSGWQRATAVVTTATMSGLPTLAKVRLIFQTVSATGGAIKFTNVQANHGVNASPVPITAPAVMASFVTPERCGAVRDGTTDDTAAWQAAVRDGRPVEVDASGPNGFGYKISSIDLDQPVEITFNGGRNGTINGCKVFPFGSSPTFNIKSSDVRILGNWYADGSVYRPTTDTPLIAVSLATGSRENIQIEGLTGYRLGGLFHVLPGGTSNNLAFTRLRRWKTFGQRGRGMVLPNVYSSFWMENLYLEWLANSLLPGDTASDLNYAMCSIIGNASAGAGGIFMRDVYWQGTNRSDTPNNKGIVFDGTTGGGGGLRMWGVDVDGAGGNGIELTKVAEVAADDLHCNSVWGTYGLLCYQTANVQITKLRANGRKELNPERTGTIGVMLDGTDRTVLTGDVGNWTSYGLGTNGSPVFRANQVDLVVYNCGGTGVKNAYTSLSLTSGQYIDVANGNRVNINGVSI